MKKLLEKLQFDRISMEYLIAVIFLGLALLVGTYKGIENLAGQIAAGMVGYIGGRMGANAEKGKVEKILPSPHSNLAYDKLSDADKAEVDTAIKKALGYDKKESFADSVKQGAE